jgi:rfaE bifunctional protein kinase chain/domain
MSLSKLADFIPSKDLLSSFNVLVVGDVMLDQYWFGDVERISPEAPVPVLLVKREEDRLGGAANVALNIKTLGGQVTLLSMVGKDEYARKLSNLLKAQGVKAVLGQDEQLQTIVKLRLIGRAQQLIRVDFEKEPDHEVLTQMIDVFKEQLPMHDVVLFSDYAKGGLTHIPLMIEIARNFGKIVLVDPKGFDYSRYVGANVITPNRAEMRQVVGGWSDERDLRSKAEVLRVKLGLDAILLTRSEEGMSLFQAENVHHVKAQVREVADVTGAGDTVIATLALMLACGINIKQAMEISNRAGGLVVSKFGTSTLTYEELFK